MLCSLLEIAKNIKMAISSLLEIAKNVEIAISSYNVI